MEIFKIAVIGNTLGANQEKTIQDFCTQFNTDKNQIVFVDASSMSEQELLAEGAFNGILYSTTLYKQEERHTLEKILNSQKNSSDLSFFVTSPDKVTDETLEEQSNLIQQYLPQELSAPVFPIKLSNQNEINAYMQGIIAPSATVFFDEVNEISDKTQSKIDAFVDITMNALRGKHPYTAGHVERVSRYVEKLAKELNFSDQELKEVVLAAKLHDIGKIGIPDEILASAKNLDFHQKEQMNYHAQLGEAYLLNLIAHNPSLKEFITPAVLEGIGNHHKHYDGYHDKNNQDPIRGEAIGKYALVIAAADCLDAMTSQRAYNNPKHILDTFRDFWFQRGKQFSPEAAEATILLLGKQIAELGINPIQMFAEPYNNELHAKDDQGLKAFFEAHANEIHVNPNPEPNKFSSLGFRLNEYGYLEFEGDNSPKWNKEIRISDEYIFQERRYATDHNTTTDRLSHEESKQIYENVLLKFEKQDNEGLLALTRGRNRNLSNELLEAMNSDYEYNDDNLEKVTNFTIEKRKEQTQQLGNISQENIEK